MEKAQLVKRVIELQRQVNREIRKIASDDAWMELNLTIAQLKSLFFITNEGSTNSGKLAAALGVTPANVTGIVERLVEQGLISRTENPEDRRMLLLQPGDKGQALLADLRERHMARLSEVLEQMSRDEISTLVQGFTSLLKACQYYGMSEKHD